MLVNVSHFTAVQNKVADALHVELEDIRRAVRLHGALGPIKAATASTEIAALQEIFNEEFADCGMSWADVLAVLHEAIAPINVQPVNQGTGARSLDYSVRDKPPGVRVIAVGGNSLSRRPDVGRAFDQLFPPQRQGLRHAFANGALVWLPRRIMQDLLPSLDH